jgi:PmbA protein
MAGLRRWGARLAGRAGLCYDTGRPGFLECAMAVTDAQALDLLERLIDDARRLGADAADAVVFEAASLSWSQRLGRPERLERAESDDVGLRVFVGKRMAIVSSSDRSERALKDLAARAVAMAKAVPEDPFCGLADPAMLASGWPDLDLADPEEPSPETLTDRARAAEEAALAVRGVTNSEGAEAAWSRTRIVMAASNGFAGGYAVTGSAVSVSVVAGEDGGMETDYDSTNRVFAADLEDPAEVGRRAGERAVRRVGSRKIASARVPVVFDPRVAGGLLRHLVGAISGPAIARGTSFLMHSLGKPVFAPGIAVIDDPHIRRGLRSKPFDAEGIANRRHSLIDDGRLTTWLLDLRSARQLGMETTGHASRGTTSPPSPAPTNLYLEAGTQPPEALIGEIERGFYVTQMLGMGVNLVTGDYSRGAAGFWIDKGELAYPVSEVTVAGSLKDMFASLTPASDLTLRYGVDAPTLRVEGLTVAGT